MKLMIKSDIEINQVQKIKEELENATHDFMEYYNGLDYDNPSVGIDVGKQKYSEKWTNELDEWSKYALDTDDDMIEALNDDVGYYEVDIIDDIKYGDIIFHVFTEYDDKNFYKGLIKKLDPIIQKYDKDAKFRRFGVNGLTANVYRTE